MKKALIYSVVSSIIFYIMVTYILEPIGMFVALGGDKITLSYHMFSYMGLVALSGIIVFCTTLVVQKINTVIQLLEKDKN
ncbi:hypothetical protein [Terrisporobacter glycolicus]|uniref:hypothetical protein n=1 Tax=Terrisporobacter glycolicus TaxID=36841 RepID=UPI0003825055|nr:hypothetical protein [Terrisporobacter glycolicus]